MASDPKKPPHEAPPAPAPHAPPAEPKGEADPPVKTIADEQRERSEEIQRIGVEAFKAKFDQRDQNEPQKAVPGVANRPVEAIEAQRR